MSRGSQGFNFDWLISDQTDKNYTIFDSYDIEKATTLIKSVALENISEAYISTNQMKYDTLNETQKHMLFKQFFAWNCNGCSIAPITDYINNPISQELPTEEKYSSKSDKKIYIGLRDSKGYTHEIEKIAKRFENTS